MIITTTKPNLATASVLKNSVGLEIIVNTEKSMYLSISGSTAIKETGLISCFWTFSDADQPEKEVTITVTPENIGEDVLLKGIEYSSYDRGQFCFLLISLTQLLDRTLLAATAESERELHSI